MNNDLSYFFVIQKHYSWVLETSKVFYYIQNKYDNMQTNFNSTYQLAATVVGR